LIIVSFLLISSFLIFLLTRPEVIPTEPERNHGDAHTEFETRCKR
jgi:hypothetical protein